MLYKRNYGQNTILNFLFFPEKTNAKNPDFQKFKNKYVLQFW